jgi:tetratricopeptide (TPR) repeat protein
MFDIIRSIKKITGLHKQEPVEDKEPKVAPVQALEHRIDKVSHFMDNVFAYVIAEYQAIKNKSKNLSKTNYELGIKHLEQGNLQEAIFRFKITKKFWPENYEAYYELIYCLIMEQDLEEAQKVIDELLEKRPDYKERIDQLFLPPEEELEVPEDLQVLEPEESEESKDLEESEDLEEPEDLEKTFPDINSDNQNNSNNSNQ